MKKLNKVIGISRAMLVASFMGGSIAIAPIATDYPAKYLFSSVYVNNIPPDTVWKHHIQAENRVFKLVDYSIDHDSKTVEVQLYGLLFPSRAVYTEG